MPASSSPCASPEPGRPAIREHPLLRETDGLDFNDTPEAHADRLRSDLLTAWTNPAFAAFLLFAVLNLGIALGALFFAPAR